MKPRRFHLFITIAVVATAMPQALANPGDALDQIPLAHDAPRDIAIASDGTLWIVDSGARQVVHLSADGDEILGTITTGDFGADEPTGVALAADSTLHIVDNTGLKIWHRNSDGSPASSVPVIDIGALGLSDPLGIDLLASGNLLVVDGFDGLMSLCEIKFDGTSLESVIPTWGLGVTSPQGVAVASDGTLWVSESDSPLLYHLSAVGSLLGTVDLSGLGVIEPRGLGDCPDATLWTIDGDSGSICHHTTAGAATGTPSEIAFSETVGLGLTGVVGITRDPYGNPWVVDAMTHRVHRLSADASASLFSFDHTPWGTDISDIDIAPNGWIYLTDSVHSAVHILTPDATSTIGSFEAADIGATQITAIALDPDSTLWAVDASSLNVHHRSLDGSVGLGSFALSPTTFTAPRDIEVSPSGTLWLANAAGASSALHQLERDGTDNALVPSLDVGASLGIISPQSIAVLDDGDILVIDSTQSLMSSVEGPPPTIAQVIHVDGASPLGVSASDELVLVFDQPVTLAGTLESDDISLSETGDSLGAFSASSNPMNPTHITLTLGAGANLTVPGSGAGSTALDVSATIEPGDIIDSSTGTPVSASSVRDVQFAMIPSGTVAIGSAGGTVSVIVSSDAVYTAHTLSVAPGALSGTDFFSLSVPTISTGLVNAVELSPGDLIFLNTDSTLTLGYTVHDLHNGEGGDEMAMRIHQIDDLGSGVFLATPLPGLQIVDPEADTVTAPMPSTDPLGLDTTPGVFATLPLDTVDDRTIIIEQMGGGAASARLSGIPGEAVLTVGLDGLYTSHQIAFPGYVESPEGIVITLREANIFERFGFPVSSGCIFTLEASSDLPTPVEVTIEFNDFPGSGDIVELDGQVGVRDQMRLVQRLGLSEPLTFHDEFPASVNENSTVITGLVTPFTSEGFAVYGLVSNPNASIPVELAVFTAD
jgi:streptogramin lyase